MPSKKKTYLNYFCEHNIYKYHCKQCIGSQICSHKKIKYACNLCKMCNHQENYNEEYDTALILIELKNGTW